jgi:hypothetical protein
LSIDALIQAIASVNNGWRIAAFAIAGILAATKLVLDSGDKAKRKPDQSKTLFLLAGFICVLGLAPIFAEVYLRHAEPSGVYRLRVLVVNPQNIPVTGATLKTPALSDTAVTSQGIAELTIPRATLTVDGKITIFADLDADALHASQEIQLADDPNPSVTIKLNLRTDATVSGLVEDESSRAITGATVSVLGGETGSTTPNGTFTLKANAAVGQEVRLHAEKTGYQSVDQDHPAGRGPVTIVLAHIKPARKH